MGSHSWFLGHPLTCAVLALQALLPFPTAHAQVPDTDAAPAQPLHVPQAVAILKQWRPDQHLYVKGNLGVSQESLNELEQWLDLHATNWTVALLESAQGEHYTDAAGQSFSGMDAVEHALGKGLPNQTAFGRLTDPRTGERNGAFFVLFLRERRFSYYGSDAQDRRGLGEERWSDQLDRPAVAAMRSGGRIVDAVKDTVTSIDRQLAERITQEQGQREQRAAAAKAEHERTQAQASAALENAAAALNLLDQKVAELQRDQPQLTGDIARPNLPGLRADLASARSALEAGNVAAVRPLSDGARQRAETLLRGIEDYRKAADAFEPLQASLDHIARAKHPATPGTLDAARAGLSAARTAYDRGDSAYARLLENTRQQVRTAEAQIEANARAATVKRNLMLTSAGATLLAIMGLGLLLNRRRRPSQREALALLDSWNKALDEKTFALFALLDRTRTIVGSSTAAVSERFAGRTLELSQRIIQDVDELIIMSACAQRILNEGKALATPANSGDRLQNLFATRRYRAAIARLRDEPIVFEPHEGLELIVRGPKSERDTLLGSLESYQPFRLSFNELIASFNQRAERALSNLDHVSSCMTGFAAALESIHDRIGKARAAEAELQAAASTDAFLQLRPVYATLLPAADADAADATQRSIRDPVGALETSAASAEQKSADALALVELGLSFQRKMRPQLDQSSQQLRQTPLRTDWLTGELHALSTHADALAEHALRSSIDRDIAPLRAALDTLVERVARAVALDATRRGPAQDSINAAEVLIRTARGEIASALHSTPESMLRESGEDPSDRLAAAREQIAGVKAALERGDVMAAHDGLEAVHHLASEATGIVQSTRKAFAEHPSALAACRAENQRLQNTLPECERLLVDLESRYVPAALLLGEGDPTHPNANGTVQDNLTETRQHLADASQRANEADQRFRDAQILAAARLLQEAAAHHALADFRLQEIGEKKQRLLDTESRNASRSAELTARVQEMSGSVQDARTMAPTSQAFEQARQQLSEAEQWRGLTPRDPFRVAATLDQVDQAFAAVTEKVRCDWDVHAEADRSLKAAAAQLQVAVRLKNESQADNLQDSPAIQQAGRTCAELADALARAQSAFHQPHGDWLQVDAEADRITTEAGAAAATLRGEMMAAQSALSELSTAAASVRRAGAWTGGFGVAIFGAPGADLLNQARAWLNQGDYQQAGRLAEAARRAAETAILEAEAEAQRRRRAEEARREAERRARAAAEQRRRSSFGGGGFGHSGAGHSTFSSHSGVSHSSFSSGSGVGRSGW